MNGRIFAEIESAQKCLLLLSYFFIIGNQLLITANFTMMSEHGLNAVNLKHGLALALINALHIHAHGNKLAVMLNVYI